MNARHIITITRTGALFLAIALPGMAQQPPAPSGTEMVAAETRVAVAPVHLDGDVLFTVRGVSALPAPERAARIADSIRQVARQATFDPASLALVDEDTYTVITAGETRLMAVVDADARLEGVGRHELARVLVERIRGAVERYRAVRRPAALVAAGLRALGATAVLVLVLWLLRWGWRRLNRRIARRVEQRLRALGVESLRAGSARRAGGALRSALGAVYTVAVLGLVFSYLHIVLGLFPWTRPVHARLASWLVAPLRTIGDAVVAALPNIVFLLILFLVLRWVIGLIRLFFDAVGRGAITLEGFDPEWAQPTFKIIRVAVVAFGVVVAYPYIPGSSTAAFKGVSIFAGVVLSLGSSSIVSNLIAGFTMTYRRAFRIGDRVRIGNVIGDVEDIRLQVTRIRTPKNEEVVIPNSTILGGEITNYSALASSCGLVLHTNVGIGYEVPWRQVEAMLLMAADRTSDILRSPPPFVLQTSLGDFAVTYELNVYCDRPGEMVHIYTELHRHILDVFNEYGVQIMTPAYEADPVQPKLVASEQWFAAPAAPPGDVAEAPRRAGGREEAPDEPSVPPPAAEPPSLASP